MATTKIGVEIDLDPSGVQRGAAAATKAVEGLGSSGAGLNKLDNAFKGLGEQALQLPGPLGRIADALLDFAPGGLVGAGVIAGLGSIALAFSAAKKAQEDGEKAVGDLTKSLLDYEVALIRVAKGEEAAAKRKLEGALALATEEAKKAREELNKLTTTQLNSFQLIGRNIQDFFAKFGVGPRSVEAIADVQKRLVDADKAIVESQEGLRQLDKDITQERIDNANKRAEAAKKEAERVIAFNKRIQDALFATQMKQLENLAAARQQARGFVAEDIAADIRKNLPDINATITGIENAAKKAQEIAAERLMNVEPFIMGAVSGLELMTQAIMQGENAFKSFGIGARAAITDILRALARQNIVEGLSSLGKGFAAAANPLTAISAGGFFKSAAQHFAAAAAAGVGAAAIGAGGAGGGAGRGGSFGVGGVGFNQSQLGGIAGEQGTLFITIQGGSVLDMSNPETAKAFARALQTATNRRIVFSGA